MKSSQDINKILSTISDKEFLRLKDSLEKGETANVYLYKTSEKIFKKFVFPYLRFEILLSCMKNAENYCNKCNSLSIKDKRKIKTITEKLQVIAYI